MWLVETKGEVRPNTALKSEAARLWSEKMSATKKYGEWRYFFLQQRSFEAGLTSGVNSLRELAQSVSPSPTEPVPHVEYPAPAIPVRKVEGAQDSRSRDSDP
jgi:hypothetical protein